MRVIKWLLLFNKRFRCIYLSTSFSTRHVKSWLLGVNLTTLCQEIWPRNWRRWKGGSRRQKSRCWGPLNRSGDAEQVNDWVVTGTRTISTRSPVQHLRATSLDTQQHSAPDLITRFNFTLLGEVLIKYFFGQCISRKEHVVLEFTRYNL